MTILAIGGTGQIDSGVVAKLADEAADVRVLTPDPEKAKVPAGVTVVEGDVLDIAGLRMAMEGVDSCSSTPWWPTN